MRPPADEARTVAGEALGRLCGLTVATAESLTAGLVSATLADTPGVSAILRGGAVTYATDAKASVLGVDADLLASGGPVQEEVALQMANGALALFGAELAVATTGVAGPGPSDGVPAGTVVIAAVAAGGQGLARTLTLEGDRASVRWRTVTEALRILYEVGEQIRPPRG